MHSLLRGVLPCAILLSLLAAPDPASAQFDKLKKKAKEKVEKKAEETLDKGTEAAPAPGAGQTEAPAEAPAAPGAATPAAGNDWSLVQKYDFVPGNKVLFFDDLSNEEMGEFPSRWNLEKGVFEIARLGSDKWIACTDDGPISPRVARGPLPEKYTVELDFYDPGMEASGHWLFIKWVDAEGKDVGRFRVGDHGATTLWILNKDVASKNLDPRLAKGIHTMRIMATRSSIKCYIDYVMVANVPKVEGFSPVGFELEVDLYEHHATQFPLLTRNFRYAEGGKTLREQMAEAGRIVTHGILFDSGSAKIRAESFKTLTDIIGLLTDDPALKVSIEGHTDSDGADAANLKLSQDRAAAVQEYLVTTGKIAAERLKSAGLGETKPVAPNDTPEGKANNRRVELVKF